MNQEHGKFGDMWFVSRMNKISGSVGNLVNQITSDDLGIAGLDWDNVEQVFNPLNSGVASIQ